MSFFFAVVITSFDFPRTYFLLQEGKIEIKAVGQQLIITKIKEEAPRKTIQQLFEMHPADITKSE